MFEFTKLMKFEVSVVVADDILHEGEKATALISKELAEKLGIKDRDYVKLTRGREVRFEAIVSEFAEGVDVVIPSGYFASMLLDEKAFKRFGAEVEKCDGCDFIRDLIYSSRHNNGHEGGSRFERSR